MKRLKIDIVYFNRDYTPYAVKRDGEIINLCEKMDIQCITENDYYLQEPGTILNGSGDFYRKFTPFYEKVALMDVVQVSKRKPGNLVSFTGELENKIALQKAFDRFVGTENSKIAVKGMKTNILHLNYPITNQNQAIQIFKFQIVIIDFCYFRI